MKTSFPQSPCPSCGVPLMPHDLFWSLRDTLYFYNCPSHGPYKRTGIGMLRFRVAASRAARRNRTRPTSLELRLAEVLDSLGLPYEQNYRVGPFLRPNGRKVYYWLDLCLLDQKIDLECSPRFWHNLPGAREKDERRTSDLEGLGYLVVTLNDRQVRDRVRLRRLVTESLLFACHNARTNRRPADQPVSYPS